MSDKSDALNRKIIAIENVAVPSQSTLNRLLEHYQNEQYGDAEKLAISITKQFPNNQFSWKVLGVVLRKMGRVSEALNASQRSVVLNPEDAEAHINLGNTLRELGRLEEAEASLRAAIVLKPGFAKAHYNLGATLRVFGRLDEAEESYTQAIKLNPDYARAHSSLGITLYKLGKLQEAEASCRQAIVLNPNFAEAHGNLGITLHELGKLQEAEASCRQAIVLNPDFAEAHGNLGITLKEIGKLKIAEESLRKAIDLKPDFAQAHSNLGIILYKNGDIDSALESMEQAKSINPKLKYNRLLLSVLKSRKSREKSKVGVGNRRNQLCCIKLTSNPLILNRAVESELIANLYEMNFRDLDRINDPSFGNARGSGYNLFEDDRSIIKVVAGDLVNLIMEAIKSDVFIHESFFTILSAGGGLNRHNHVGNLDRDSSFNLANQKYSLVYYLSIGDQDCSEPGVLKLYDPIENVLPCEGMITIFPASRDHSVLYNGKKDRAVIGINFYSL